MEKEKGPRLAQVTGVGLRFEVPITMVAIPLSRGPTIHSPIHLFYDHPPPNLPSQRRN